MKVSELKSYIDRNRKAILTSVLNRKYVPKPIRRVEKRGYESMMDYYLKVKV